MGAAKELADRLHAVGECSARVRATVREGARTRVRDFYLSEGTVVEYARREGDHEFGPRRSEGTLAAELARAVRAADKARLVPLRMSAGDYLVFAVFARDLRSSREAATGADTPMSLDEVLAYFDEPETRVVRTPNDETWQASVEELLRRGVLVAAGGGYALHADFHALAREIVADHQHTVVRFDFLDEQWLFREVSLYPSADAVYRLGSEVDGSVAIEELSSATLVDVIAEVVSSLPNLVDPEVHSALESSSL